MAGPPRKKPSDAKATRAGSKSRRPKKAAAKPAAPKPAEASTPPPLPAPRDQRLRVWLVGLGVLLVLAAGAVSALRRLGGSEFELRLGEPTALTPGELRAFASPTRPVYWLGPPHDGKLEVTRTSRSAVYVRYLPQGVDVGDPHAGFTTIGTYSVPNAYEVLTRSARRPGSLRARAAGGALAVWRRAKPTSVYVARRGSNYLVEVYDPSPRRARSLATGGRVRPVP